MESNRKNQSGQAFAEYIVGVIVLMTACFVPIASLENKTAIELLTDAFQKNYQGYEYVMSQPVDE